MRQGVLVTAGERLAVDCAVSWVGDLIEEAADGGLTTGGAEEATVQIRVEATRDPFETSGWRPRARDGAGPAVALPSAGALGAAALPGPVVGWHARSSAAARLGLYGRRPGWRAACRARGGRRGDAGVQGSGGRRRAAHAAGPPRDGDARPGGRPGARPSGGAGARVRCDRLGAAVRPGDRGEVAGHRHLHGTGTAPLLGLRGHPGGGDGHRPAPPPGRRGRGRVRRTRAGDPRHPPEPTRARVAGAARHRGPGGRYVDVKVLTTDRRPPSARVFESRDAPANPAVLELLGSKLVGADLASAPVVLPDFHHKSSMEMPSSIAVATHGTIRPTLTSSSVNCGMALIAFDADVPDQAAITRFYEAVRERFPHPTTRRRDLSAREVMRAAEEGGAFAADRYGVDPAGLSRMEKDGRIDLAPHGGIGRLRRELPWVVVQLARMRFGTIGPSNHFVELQRVEEVFDERAARLLGVRQGQLTLQYHGGGGVLAGQLGRLCALARRVPVASRAVLLGRLPADRRRRSRRRPVAARQRRGDELRLRLPVGHLRVAVRVRGAGLRGWRQPSRGRLAAQLHL